MHSNNYKENHSQTEVRTAWRRVMLAFSASEMRLNAEILSFSFKVKNNFSFKADTHMYAWDIEYMFLKNNNSIKSIFQ